MDELEELQLRRSLGLEPRLPVRVTMRGLEALTHHARHYCSHPDAMLELVPVADAVALVGVDRGDRVHLQTVRM